MPAQPLELILGRQFVDTLSLPAFLVDPEGNLLFYNEPAGVIFGLNFGETGGMRVEEWSTVFTPFDEYGKPIDPEELPLVKTLRNQTPNSGSFYIHSMNGDKIHIKVNSFPIIARPERFLGALALFWKTDP
ncbi:MAG: hypothetical protein HWE15_01130 [Algoriphagus sp.]|uniref:hypothetical protein n=1 Tax=Algoriphagus sp. TaxID=1872435 RepID=UPI001837AF18|nr:hypothetical protein [Algoriphagus sp.]NVJ84877.1 hypothetical protein [Algoriphagus sp.]